MQSYQKEYEYYLTGELALSLNTVKSYLHDIEKYCGFLTKYRGKAIRRISKPRCQSYLASLKRRHIASSSQARNLTAIKSFHKFLLLEKYVTKNVTKAVDARNRKKLPIILSIAEVERILASLKKIIRSKSGIKLLLKCFTHLECA